MARYDSLDQVIESLERNFKPEKAAGADGIYQLHYTGEDGGDWYLAVENQQLTVSEGTHDAPDVTVTSTADDWLKIANGDLNPMMAMMTGKLKVQGSIPKATKLQALFF
ncbi:MAG: SCP2 sterol-binding domain-containing protein [Bacteroidota bacterium]